MADETNIPAGVPEGTAPAPVEQVQTPPAQTEQPAAPVSALVTPPEAPTNALNSEVTEDGSVEYEQTGIPALDVSLTFFGSLGIAGDDTAMAAAAKGNFALLEAKLATMGDKAQGWQQMVALAKSAYTDSVSKMAEASKKTDAAILSVVQSADNWNAIKAWAAKNADPAEKAEINRMIDAGPVQARAAATLLLEAYKKAPGNSINPPSPLGNASPAAEISGGLLSPREYAQEVATLHRKLGTRMESSPEYRALQRRLAR